MQPAGMEKLHAAKKDGSWTFLDDIEDLIIPEDLDRSLEQNTTAKTNFEAFSSSSKKQILYGIASAKKQDTRPKRIKKQLNWYQRIKNPEHII